MTAIRIRFSSELPPNDIDRDDGVSVGTGAVVCNVTVENNCDISSRRINRSKGGLGSGAGGREASIDDDSDGDGVVVVDGVDVV
jgi:hypothetical protein